MVTEVLESTDEQGGAWFNFEWSGGTKAKLFVPGVGDEVDFLTLVSDEHFRGFLAVKAPGGRRFFINAWQILAFDKA